MKRFIRQSALILCFGMLIVGARGAAAQMMGGAGGNLVRGTVTAAGVDKLTVKTDTGETYDVVAGSNARIMKDRQPVKMGDFKIGDSVAAAGQLDAATKTLHALFVTAIDPEQEKKMREGLGKVYIAGKITAIDETKLTIERPDKVVQVIEVDENTSFKKGGRMAIGGGAGASGGSAAGGGGGESITLADFKVGDNVMGPGAVKDKIFVATQLNLIEQRQRRKPADAAPVVAPK